VGRLRKELDRQGVGNNTFLIYMADNGRPFPRCKTRLYDSGIKSPLIIACPGTVDPGICKSLVSVNIDLGPTILELAGVQKSPRMQGVSLTRLLTDPAAKVRDVVFSEQNWHVMQAHQRMVRRGKYLYIRNAYPERQAMCVEAAPKFPAGKELWDAHAVGKLNQDQMDIFLVPRPAEELYDVESDPHQLKNLTTDDQFAGQTSELRSILDRWTGETRDSIPSDPTPDREDAYGNRNKGFRYRVQPGVEVGSLQTNEPGPVLLN
jgi:arylsulfatase